MIRDKWMALAYALMAAALLMALPAGRAGAANISSGQESLSDEIRYQVEDYIASQLPAEVSDWNLADLTLPSADRFPADFDRFEVTSRDRTMRGNRVSLDIKFYKNSSVIKRLYARAQVEAYAGVVVPNRIIERGEVATSDSIRLEKMKVSFPVSDFCTDVAQVEGKAAERRLSEGRAIRVNEVKTPPTVRAGDRVMIVAENMSLKITAKGIARSDGEMGEVIPVINLRSNKRVYARVTGGSSVRVVF